MKITRVGEEAVAGLKGYLSLHQDRRTRGWHYVGIGGGAAVGVALTKVGFSPECAIPAAIATAYACAIPSHLCEEGKGKTAGTLQELGKIERISDVPRRIGKVVFYMFCDLAMFLMAATGTLKPVMRNLGLNPSGANNVETPLPAEDKK